MKPQGPTSAHPGREQSRLLRDGLQRLSLEHRTVLELVFYQGLSLDETARVCGCPVGTVKSRLSYAKNSLRGELSRAGLAAEDIR
jgi:RNA polymerase sigma-70 factor (ECF subfamily)